MVIAVRGYTKPVDTTATDQTSQEFIDLHMEAFVRLPSGSIIVKRFDDPAHYRLIGEPDVSSKGYVVWECYANNNLDWGGGRFPRFKLTWEELELLCARHSL